MVKNQNIAEISKLRSEAFIKALISVYVDFMPMMQTIRYNLSILDAFDNEESKKYILNEVNKQLDRAISLLNQFKKIYDLNHNKGNII